jgi:hypothetical protein
MKRNPNRTAELREQIDKLREELAIAETDEDESRVYDLSGLIHDLLGELKEIDV